MTRPRGLRNLPSRPLPARPCPSRVSPCSGSSLPSEQSPSPLASVTGTVHPGPSRKACQAPPIITQSLSPQPLQEPFEATPPRWSGSETLPLVLTLS